jgi:cell division protein FtsB
MARSRKTQSAELRFGPALKALLICFFLGGAGVGYVYQKDLLDKLSHEKREREQELNRLQLDNAQKSAHLDRLNSQRQLQERARRMHPDLGLPTPDQVVVLPLDPVAEAEAGGRQYAQGGVRTEVQR